MKTNFKPKTEKELLELLKSYVLESRFPLTAAKAYLDMLKEGQYKGKEKEVYEKLIQSNEKHIDELSKILNILKNYDKQK